jgi:hypothetical protein
LQFTKIILNRNQLNEVREAETIMGVEIGSRKPLPV